MKFTLLFSLSLFFLPVLFALQETLHPWTDLQGRTLQASFIKSDGVTLTINWNGRVIPIPLATLSPASQSLAKKLSLPATGSNPFDSITPSNSEKLYPWTDMQGRTLEGVFITADSNSVTVKWQGKVVPLPLANLNSESKALASRLAGESEPVKQPAPMLAKMAGQVVVRA